MNPVAEFPDVKAGAKYPWEKLADGQAWEVDPMGEFGVDAQLFRHAAYMAAARMGKRVRTRIIDGRVFVQFYERGEA